MDVYSDKVLDTEGLNQLRALGALEKVAKGKVVTTKEMELMRIADQSWRPLAQAAHCRTTPRVAHTSRPEKTMIDVGSTR